MKMNNKGFTLVELLAVLALLVIIGGIAIPNVISLMNNNKKDNMVNDAQRLISLAKNMVAKDQEFRKATTSSKQYKMSEIDPKKTIHPDPDGGDYDRTASYVKYTKNTGYCIYLKGSKKAIRSNSGTGCVKEEQLNRSSVKDL